MKTLGGKLYGEITSRCPEIAEICFNANGKPNGIGIAVIELLEEIGQLKKGIANITGKEFVFILDDEAEKLCLMAGNIGLYSIDVSSDARKSVLTTLATDFIKDNFGVKEPDIRILHKSESGHLKELN